MGSGGRGATGPPGLALICGTGVLLAQEPAPKSTTAGVFTDEQAKRGAAAYSANCAACHGAELRSSDREIPHLTEKSFKFGWIGKTIAERFEFIRETMPPKVEQKLPDQVYLDIVTYILRFNKIPSGDRPLKADVEILKQILIEAPPD